MSPVKLCVSDFSSAGASTLQKTDKPPEAHHLRVLKASNLSGNAKVGELPHCFMRSNGEREIQRPTHLRSKRSAHTLSGGANSYSIL